MKKTITFFLILIFILSMSLTLVGCNAANYDSKMTYYQLQSDLGKIKSSNTSFEKVNSELINSMGKYLLAQSQSFDRYYFCDEREYGDATAKILDGTTNKIVFTGPIFNYNALEFVAYGYFAIFKNKRECMGLDEEGEYTGILKEDSVKLYDIYDRNGKIVKTNVQKIVKDDYKIYLDDVPYYINRTTLSWSLDQPIESTEYTYQFENYAYIFTETSLEVFYNNQSIKKIEISDGSNYVYTLLDENVLFVQKSYSTGDKGTYLDSESATNVMVEQTTYTFDAESCKEKTKKGSKVNTVYDSIENCKFDKNAIKNILYANVKAVEKNTVLASYSLYLDSNLKTIFNVTTAFADYDEIEVLGENSVKATKDNITYLLNGYGELISSLEGIKIEAITSKFIYADGIIYDTSMNKLKSIDEDYTYLQTIGDYLLFVYVDPSDIFQNKSLFFFNGRAFSNLTTQLSFIDDTYKDMNIWTIVSRPKEGSTSKDNIKNTYQFIDSNCREIIPGKYDASLWERSKSTTTALYTINEGSGDILYLARPAV